MEDEFASFLGQFLEEIKLSQYRLAYLSDLSPVCVNRLARGRRPPSEVQVYKIAAGSLMGPGQKRVLNEFLARTRCESLPVPEEEGELDV